VSEFKYLGFLFSDHRKDMGIKLQCHSKLNGQILSGTEIIINITAKAYSKRKNKEAVLETSREVNLKVNTRRPSIWLYLITKM